ncbi:dihydrofolate synthase/folylpolyglutamate synthase [Labedella gwakjiensis]|uniref:tetrahydrofolate synthase n=1 Tax=Labedella gwakjiensis TaxID=390269 RepID=A0A2P8H0F2_9MICO|nr:folylpolyglutamate synthase/dihydrofolate synthase family protein [Labedella gwakjiensis]PSL39693.1 dihydrofolate synthase/folylpolyglutamate synthase [Labedella gwakjiensis]RUQ85921.1 bifunctional folylpolyglutamate synthase/dihydrofolate synthase [Labedella gwakjiensis]
MTEDAENVYQALLGRVGEGAPRRRLAPTRRVLELLGDPQRAYPIIQIAGTNGKTSTSRITESILRAYGLRTGLFTSPHFVSFTERITIDGEPISDEAIAANWDDITPYVEMVDAELEAAGEKRLTFFEVLTVLAFASFADAPVDVAVVEVGMGGEWDSTNAADAAIAVFTPIGMDHAAQLGNTVAEIARTKSGIVKPGAVVVTAPQAPEALAEIERAAELSEATLVRSGTEFELLDDRVAVGGQLITVRGRAATYDELYLPLYGDHQGVNASVAIAAVESFLGGGAIPLAAEPLGDGVGSATSPGRLQLIGADPTILVDAAHNPHGAESLVAALGRYFDANEIAFVVGILSDKDAAGILTTLAPIAARFHLTQPESDRSIPFEDLASIARVIPGVEADGYERVEDALEDARTWAAAGEKRIVVVTGSIVLGGEAAAFADDQGWKP